MILLILLTIDYGSGGGGERRPSSLYNLALSCALESNHYWRPVLFFSNEMRVIFVCLMQCYQFFFPSAVSSRGAHWWEVGIYARALWCHFAGNRDVEVVRIIKPALATCHSPSGQVCGGGLCFQRRIVLHTTPQQLLYSLLSCSMILYTMRAAFPTHMHRKISIPGM